MRQWSGFGIRYGPTANGKANVKAETPLESCICQWSFDSNIRKGAG